VSLLFVDDDRESLKMLDALRAAQGARVTTAGTAKEASALVVVNQFDPIVSDIGSPAWTDPRCSARCASCARCIAGPHGRKRALAAGFNKHLDKLLETDALLDLLSEFGATARR
jgi:hypothetical protein